jgi:thiol-disulfide isomerase/thioredoxin
MRLKKHLKEFVAGLLFLAVVSLGLDYWRAPAHLSQTLLEESFRTVTGERYEVAAMRPELIYFFTPRCPVCKLQTPVMNALSRTYRIVGIASFSDVNAAKRYIRDKNVTFPVIADAKGVLTERLGVTVFPTVLFVDANATPRFSTSGYTTSAGIEARMAVLRNF